MPRLIRHLGVHALAGTVIGWGVLAAFFALDISNLRTLVAGSPDGPLAVFLLAFFFALTFASLAMGYAAMHPPKDDDDVNGGRRARWRGTLLSGRLAPAPVRIKR